MTFLHDERDFSALVSVVGARTGIAAGLIETDYWITHLLWSLQQLGFNVWFRGGTSLSKGFGLIQRFSEDLDVRLDPPVALSSPAVSSWKSETASATRQRAAWSDHLIRTVQVPGMSLSIDAATTDPGWRSIGVRATYAGHHLGTLPGALRPFVLLEVGHARVTPASMRRITSFVHDHVWAGTNQVAEVDNRPLAVACVHPAVTALEKLDAIARRFPREDVEPAAFVRHYEDVAMIVQSLDRIGPVPGFGHVAELAADLVAARQMRRIPAAGDDVFNPGSSPQWNAVQDAHEAIGDMFWGPRLSLEKACDIIRAWINRELTPK